MKNLIEWKKFWDVINSSSSRTPYERGRPGKYYNHTYFWRQAVKQVLLKLQWGALRDTFYVDVSFSRAYSVTNTYS